MTFHGKPRADHHTMEHVHESPAIMTGPLIVLAVGALCAGFVFHDQLIGHDWAAFWASSIRLASGNNVLAGIEDVPSLIHWLPTVVGLAGIAVAYWFYMLQPGIPARITGMFPAAYRFFLNKWYFDELYNFLFVGPARALAGKLWTVGDATIIDGIPNGVAALTEGASAQAVRIQTGSIAVYAFVMLIGLVVLVSIYLLFLS